MTAQDDVEHEMARVADAMADHADELERKGASPEMIAHAAILLAMRMIARAVGWRNVDRWFAMVVESVRARAPQEIN